jgi:hypothetical protein
MATYTISNDKGTGLDVQVRNQGELSTALWNMRVDAQRFVRRGLMSLPRNPPPVDVRSRRDPDAATSIRIGSTTPVDISSAIFATNVVRVVPGS